MGTRKEQGKARIPMYVLRKPLSLLLHTNKNARRKHAKSWFRVPRMFHREKGGRGGRAQNFPRPCNYLSRCCIDQIFMACAKTGALCMEHWNRTASFLCGTMVEPFVEVRTRVPSVLSGVADQ